MDPVLQRLLTVLALQQDYFWFLGLLAWGCALVWWWVQPRRETDWRWLPWAAVAGMASALIEMAAMSLPVVEQPRIPPYWHWDLLHGVVTSMMVAGWWWELGRTRRLRMSLCLAAVLVVGLTEWARAVLPEWAVWDAAGLNRELAVTGAWTLALAGSVAGLVNLRGLSGRVRQAQGVALVLLWGSCSGPLAESVPWLTARRWAHLDTEGLVWCGVQLLAAAGLLLCLRPGGPKESAAPAQARERVTLLAACAVWLTAGLVLAGLMGSLARRGFESSALSRARVAAAFMDVGTLDKLLNADFNLTAPHWTHRPGLTGWFGSVARMKTPLGGKIADNLSTLELANPDAEHVMFGTLHQGWWLLVSSQRTPGPVEGVVLYRRSDPKDAEDWRLRRGGYLRPFPATTGLATLARAPLLAADGRMLGWLVIQFPIPAWNASQAQARLLAFVIVALGLGLAILVSLQRQRVRERETARAEAVAALQADQLKTAFLAKVSHELRTPIQSILGYGELLRPAVSDAVSRGRLQALRQHTDLMLRLVNDLLDLSAIQAGQFRLKENAARLPELVRQTVESLRPRAEAKGLVYTCQIDDSVPEWARVDAERVRQIVLNLVTNAVKFTDRGRVGVRFTPGLRADEVRLMVSDTGPGIPPAERARLFQPFARLEATAAKEGTGLGLSLAAALCRSMGGGIVLETASAAGAAFTASFRAPACPSPADRPADHRQPGRRLQGWRVLVADDNALVRELFLAFLQEEGASCVAVADGAAALQEITPGRFDCVVLDLAMPRLDGIETARQLRAGGATGLRIVGVSAHANERDRLQALAAGIDVFLTKPVELDSLARALCPDGAAPVGPSQRHEELTARLRSQFRAEAAVQRAAVLAGLEEHDSPAVRSTAHYLRNSAIVVQADELAAACARLEQAAETADHPAMLAAWRECDGALARWMGPEPFAAGMTPVVEPKP